MVNINKLYSGNFISKEHFWFIEDEPCLHNLNERLFNNMERSPNIPKRYGILEKARTVFYIYKLN